MGKYKRNGWGGHCCVGPPALGNWTGDSRRHNVGYLLLGLFFALLGTPTCSQSGQVTIDNSFGKTPQSLPGPNFLIDSSKGKPVGNNLFYSFGQFKLETVAGTTESATFQSPANIQNILCRVTGTDPSSIDGLIRSVVEGTGSISDANLFFMNPHGVFFGEHARTDVGGSFVVTTANYIRLADGNRFDTSNPASHDALLTSAPPAAFGFLGPTPASVTLAGPGGEFTPPNLIQVSDGKSIAIVAGNVQMANAGLSAPGGRVALVSLDSAGEVSLNLDNPSAPVDTSSLDPMGDVQLSDFALIDVSGVRGGKVTVDARNLELNLSNISAQTLGDENGLGVQLQIRDSLSLLNGATVSTLAFASGEGGTIDVTARSVIVDGLADSGGASGSGINTVTAGDGKAGDIVITTDSLIVQNGANLTAATAGPGDGGNIRVTAHSILLDAHGSAANFNAFTFEGKSGNIILKTDSLEMADGAQISTDTFGPSDGGRIEVTASSIRLDGEDRSGAGIPPSAISARAEGDVGRGGEIIIAPPASGTLSLEVDNGAQISASTSFAGDGGNIHITATTMVLDGNGSGISANSSDGAGNGGGIQVFTGSAVIRNGAQISASTSDEGKGGDINITASSITMNGSGVATGGAGNSGDIQIHAGLVNLSEGAGAFTGIAVSSTAAAGGNAGTITIGPRASGSLALNISDGASISATTFGSGAGGNIMVDATQISLASGGVIQSAAFGAGVAGDVVLHATDVLTLRDGSSVSVSAATSDGGDISVTAGNQLRIEKGSSITAAAFQNGGNITLQAGEFVYVLHSTVSAAATGGDGGNINIDPPFVVLSHAPINANSALSTAGNIFVDSRGFFASDSLLTATGVQNGTVEILSPDVDLTGSMLVLSGSLLDAESQLRPSCAVKTLGGFSSFIVVGRGGLPAAPDRLSASFDW